MKVPTKFPLASIDSCARGESPCQRRTNDTPTACGASHSGQVGVFTAADLCNQEPLQGILWQPERNRLCCGVKGVNGVTSWETQTLFKKQATRAEKLAGTPTVDIWVVKLAVWALRNAQERSMGQCLRKRESVSLPGNRGPQFSPVLAPAFFSGLNPSGALPNATVMVAA